MARESELEKLANDISVLRSQRKEADRRNQEIVAEGNVLHDALKAEKKRTGELEMKIERLLATLADSEDKLDRAKGSCTASRTIEGRGCGKHSGCAARRSAEQ